MLGAEGIVTLLMLLACLDSHPPPPEGPEDSGPRTPEDCWDGVDNDLDGWVDRDDSDCVEDCHDGVDNNANGDVDCQDRDCLDASECQEICDDGLDNDSDGDVDCLDVECFGEPICKETCDDGVDNNGDGATDCRDWRCVDDPYCQEDCSDGVDNDLDGSVDCHDGDCKAKQDPCIEVCDDGVDNDLDGRMDCEDSECRDLCEELDCQDGLDDDSDGWVDCDDSECWGRVGCQARSSVTIQGGWGTGKQVSVGSPRSPGSFNHRIIAYDLSGQGSWLIDSVSQSCTWHAAGLRYTQTQWRSGAQGKMWVSELSSSGGCSGRLVSGVISTSYNHYTSNYWPLGNRRKLADIYVWWPARAHWFDGSIHASSTSHYTTGHLSSHTWSRKTTFFSFILNPGEPWVRSWAE